MLLYSRCHNLVYASFCYCEHVTDAGVELLGTLPSLTSLDLSGCNIQDQGVAALGNNPRFRDITLAECRNITDLGLQVRRNTSTHFRTELGWCGEWSWTRGGGDWTESKQVLLNTKYRGSLSSNWTLPVPRNSQFSKSKSRGKLQQATPKDKYASIDLELKIVQKNSGKANNKIINSVNHDMWTNFFRVDKITFESENLQRR